MSSSTKTRGILSSGAAAAACLLLAFLAAAAGASTKTEAPGPPRAVTGGVSHVRGTSVELSGSVNPHNLATEYWFVYGPAKGAPVAETPHLKLAPSAKSTKVAVSVNGFVLGEYYKLEAQNSADPSLAVSGKEKQYASKTNKAKFTLSKTNDVDIYGSPIYITGSLAGTDIAGRSVVLQSSGYPYLEPFATISKPAITNAAGQFTFKVTNLTMNTQFRAATVEAHQLLSTQLTVRVEAKVAIHVRHSATTGLVRVYGTIAPAQPGARVVIQYQKAIRPNKREKETTWATAAFGKSTKATLAFSRYSVFVKVKTTGRYRAYVELKKKSPLSPGASASVVLHAVPASLGGGSKGHHKK